MNSYGSFGLEVKVPPGESAEQRANEILMLMREEIADPKDFLGNLEDTCKMVAEFLKCDLELSEESGKLTAKFIFEGNDGNQASHSDEERPQDEEG